MASSTHGYSYSNDVPEIDPYATHMRVVATAAYRCARLYEHLPMLEIGAGHYSTPIIHAIAPAHTLIEADGAWAAQFAWAGARVARWREYKSKTPHLKYSFAFLDNEELVIHRIKHIPDLLALAYVVAMHDVRENAMPNAKYNYVDKMHRPWTWVGSNDVDVAAWFQ